MAGNRDWSNSSQSANRFKKPPLNRDLSSLTEFSFVEVASGDEEDDDSETQEVRLSFDTETGPSTRGLRHDQDQEGLFEMDEDMLSRSSNTHGFIANLLGGNRSLSSSSPTDKETTDALILEAKRVGPRCREIVDLPSHKLFLLSIGCQGENTTEQGIVAALADRTLMDLRRTHHDADSMIYLVLGGGDNVYPNYLKHANDVRIHSHFYKYYRNPSLSFLNKLAWLVAPGNHDENYTKKEIIKTEGKKYIPFSVQNPKGAIAGFNEVAHSYIQQDTDPKLNCSKREFYKALTISYPKLPMFNMPYLFDTWCVGKLQIFRMDSNTILEDFCNLFIPKNQDEKFTPTSKNDFIQTEGNPEVNQVAWLRVKYRECISAGRTPILLQHQPFFDPGRRAFTNNMDAKLYFLDKAGQPDEAARRKLCILLGLSLECVDFALMHRTFHQMENFLWFMLFCAHVHATSVRNNINDPNEPYKIWQVISGGGGGEAQHQKLFADPNIGAFSGHGFFTVTCNINDPINTMEIELVNEDHLHLKFNKNSCHPVLENPHQDCVLTLRKVLLEVCLEYSELNAATVDINELECLPKIISLLTEPNTFGYATNVVSLNEYISSLPNQASPLSLYNVINKRLKAEHSLGRNTFQVIYQEVHALKELHSLVLGCCNDFQHYLARKQEETNGDFLNYRFREIGILKNLGLAKEAYIETDIRYLQKIMNYLNQTDFHTLQDTYDQLHAYTQNLKDTDSEHSLFRTINNKLVASRHFGETLDSLAQPKLTGRFGMMMV